MFNAAAYTPQNAELILESLAIPAFMLSVITFFWQVTTWRMKKKFDITADALEILKHIVKLPNKIDGAA